MRGDRGRNSSGGTGMATKRGPTKTKSGPLVEAEQQLHDLRQQLQSAQAALERESHREKVMVDMLRHMDLVLLMLQQREGLLEDDAPDSAAAAAAVAQLAPHSHIAQLLLDATPEQLAAVEAMTWQDWVKHRVSTFQQGTMLLELLRRPEGPQHSSDLVSDASCSSSVATTGAVRAPSELADSDASPAAGAAALLAPPAASRHHAQPQRDGREQQQQHEQHEQHYMFNPSQERPSACTTGADPALGAAGMGTSASECMLHLRQLIDQEMLLGSLAIIFKPAPYFEAAARDPSSLKTRPPPLSYWVGVARRMRLTDWQLLHTEVALQEFQRLRNGCAGEGAALVQESQASCSALIAAVLGPGSSSTGRDQPDAAAAAAAAGAAAAAAAATGPAAMPQATGAAGQQQQQQQQQDGEAGDQQPQRQQSMADSNGAAGGAWGGDLSTRLQRNLQRWLLVTQAFAFVWVNSLSLLQLATMFVASYPYSPVPSAVAAAAMWERQQQQRREQQRRRQQQQQQQQELGQGQRQGEAGGSGPAVPETGDQTDPPPAQQPAGAAVAAMEADDLLIQLMAEDAAMHLRRHSSMLQRQCTAWWHE